MKQAYTTEFNELAVKRFNDGQSISAVVKELGLSDQALRNWVNAAAQGKLNGAGSKVVTPEQMELYPACVQKTLALSGSSKS